MEKYNLIATPINEEQCIRLTKMCDSLFPNYLFSDLSLNCPMYITYYEKGSVTPKAISWFELCIMDISIQLSKLTGKSWESIHETWLYSQTDHLVDYLYNIYETCKK